MRRCGSIASAAVSVTSAGNCSGSRLAANGGPGWLGSRARAIVALAQALDRGRLRLDRGAPVAATVAALDALPGVGPWTAHYIAMRALGWGDAFPHPDVAVLKAMGERSPAAAARRAEQWRPWRAYAVLHLWRSL